MARLRLAVKKDGALQFLSHLDFARVVRYVIIRAALPICYSEGFNPHMKLSFASALGVGVSADAEYLDMELEEVIPAAEVVRKMNAAAPSGLVVLDGVYVDEKAPKLMAVANYAVYRLCGPVKNGAAPHDADAALQRFNEAEEVLYERISPKDKRKIRCIDMKQHVIEPITGAIAGGYVSICVSILQTDAGSVKPSQIWEVLCRKYALPAEPDMMLARRIGLYHRCGSRIVSLFHHEKM